MPDFNLSILAKDDPRILARVAGLTARLGLALKSMSLVASRESGICRMSIVITTEPVASELLRRLLSRLIDVRAVDVRLSNLAPALGDRQRRGSPQAETALPVNA